MGGGVVLVNPPFAAIERPSLGLGLLQASARREGIACTSLHANVAFARRIGADAYHWLANLSDCRDLVAEWTFAGSLFPERDGDAERFLEEFLPGTATAGMFRFAMPGRDARRVLREVRAAAEAFVDELAAEIVAGRPAVVGCTSSFQQNGAALALLKRIRERDGEVVTLLGGPNCEGPMAAGLRRRFPWVDLVVSGEAEESFPGVLRLLLAQGRAVDEETLPAGWIGGARARAAAGAAGAAGAAEAVGAARPSARLVVRDLASTPVPDYDDYFAQLAASGLADRVRPGLPLEASRGCWWALKKPCTFCGLNGVEVGYRTKAPARVVEEIEALCARHATPRVEFVDNNLDPKSVTRICAALRGRTPPLALFFETRVLGRRQLATMADAGVNWLQVGIESFDPRVLALIGKGTSPLQNVQVLRLALELGVRVTYNVLHGVPGEEDAWYREMSRLLPLVEHLEPPCRLVRVRFDRFSEYAERPERFGLRLVPYRSYGFVYPLAAEEIAEFAYFFEDAGARTPPARAEGVEAFRQSWLAWRATFFAAEPGEERAVLELQDVDGRVLRDTRRCAVERVAELSPLEAAVLRFCDEARTLPQVEAACGEIAAREGAPVRGAVRALLDRRVLAAHGGRFLSLAVAPPRRPLPEADEFPGGSFRSAPALTEPRAAR